MYVEELSLRSSAGLLHPLKLEGLRPGLVLLVGPNASGKSTLGRLLRGTLWPAQAPADFGAQEFWDLCLVVDPVTEDQAAARKEVDELVKLLRKEGLTITDPEPLDPEEGFVGKVFALCTASQGELEQEAELMGINKPLKLSLQAQRKYRKSAQYGRVTAIFTAARREAFHKVPYFCPHPFQDDVLKPEHDHSGFEYFSACERQYLLEHMIESKVREAVRNHKMQPD